MTREKYLDGRGYYRYSHNGRLVHREVALNNIYKKGKYSKPFSSYVVHHKDEDKTNNSSSNLRIMTQEQHNNHHQLNQESSIQEARHTGNHDEDTAITALILFAICSIVISIFVFNDMMQQTNTSTEDLLFSILVTIITIVLFKKFKRRKKKLKSEKRNKIEKLVWVIFSSILLIYIFSGGETMDEKNFNMPTLTTLDGGSWNDFNNLCKSECNGEIRNFASSNLLSCVCSDCSFEYHYDRNTNSLISREETIARGNFWIRGTCGPN